MLTHDHDLSTEVISQAAQPSGGRGSDPGAAPAAGLVSSKTSVTLFRHEARLKRLKKSVVTVARLQTEETQHGGRRWRVGMATLTYRPGVNFTPKHVTEFLKRVRAWLARRGFECRYCWVLELTKAGVPHYHVLFWLPRGVTLPKPDKQGWWAHGCTRVEWVTKAVGYLAKYASKGTEGAKIPAGARLHGNGGLTMAGRSERSWWMCPKWIRELWGVEHRPKRATGGGWLSRLTGEFEPSRWRLVERCAGWSWMRFEPVEVVV